LFVIRNVCGRVTALLMAGGDGPGVGLSANPTRLALIRIKVAL
jgi:hypothetical protein